MKTGIDVSYAQGVIDWTKVNADFAYIKLNTGVNFEDTQVTANAIGASNKGIPLGYYHFATLNNVNVVADATSEANDLLAMVKPLPKHSQGLDFALDIEVANTLGISPNNIQLWITTFQNVLQDAREDMVLYSYKPWLDANLPQSHTLGGVRLWLSQFTGAGKPILPFGWSDYFIWQWTDKGQIAGITANTVDLDRGNF